MPGSERPFAARRLSIRPAADGMAYLTVLGPLHETVGAYAALRANADAGVTGQAADEPAGRGRSAVKADTALRRRGGPAALGAALDQGNAPTRGLGLLARLPIGGAMGQAEAAANAAVGGLGQVPGGIGWVQGRVWWRG